jgi:hypothetical protein
LHTASGRLATGAVATVALAMGTSAALAPGPALAAHRPPAIARVALHLRSAISVTTPTVPVKLPTVPLKPPPLPVKAPTVPVKPPPLPVKTPTVPVKPPPVPVKPPTVPVKPPPLPVKAPTVPVKPPPPKAPTVKAPVPVKSPPKPSPSPVKAPTAPVNLPATPSPRTPSTVRSLLGGLAAPATRRLTGAGVPAPGPSSSARSSIGPAQAPGGFLVSAAGTSLPSAGSVPSGYAAPPELPDVARLLAEGHGRLDNARVRALVLGLQGCLTGLPNRLRSLLELRTGVGRSRALSPTRAAHRLRIPRGRVTRLELTALRRLRRLAETTGCAVAAQPQAAFPLAGYDYLLAAGSGGPPLGGVESVRYEQAPSQAGVQPLPPPGATAGPPGLTSLHSGGSPFWVIAAVLLGLVLLAAALDGLGLGPRHRYHGGTGGKH